MKVTAVLILYVLSGMVALSAATTNYCKAGLCRNGKKHIACGNNGAFAKKCASNAKAITMTASLKTAILTKHNTLRNKIANGGVTGFKKAARMATMQWSDELAKLAKLNAKQCEMKHDQCRNTDQFPWAGQNLAVSGWSGDGTKTVVSVVRSHIQMWFDENKYATMAQMNNYWVSGKPVGHFIQMVVEKATHVGCAVVRQKKNGNNEHYTACNYAFIPFMKEPVYRRATKAGSGCTTGTHQTYHALCSTREVYNVQGN